MRGAGETAPTLRLERGRLRPGLLARLLREPPVALAELATGKDAVRLRLGRRDALLVNHPALVEQLFADDPEHSKAATFAVATATRLGGVSLPNVTGPAHADRRRVVEAVFAPEALAPFTRPTLGAVAEVTATWRPGATVNLGTEFERLQTLVLGRLTFGHRYDAGSAALHDYLGVSRDVVGRFLNPLAPVLWRLPLPLTRRFERTQAAFSAAVGEEIRDRRSASANGDLLSRLLRAPAAGPPLGDDEARDEAWSYFSQGVIQYALPWIFSLLGRHPEAADGVRSEAGAVADDDGPAAAGELPFTQAVVREALRLYPPGWLIVRQATRSREVAGREFPAGTRLLVSPYAVQRDGRFWSRPLDFDPGRWLGERADEIVPYSFLTFGVGPRRCPARALAELVLVLVVARISREWRLDVAAAEPAYAYVPFLRPKDGVPATLERRS